MPSSAEASSIYVAYWIYRTDRSFATVDEPVRTEAKARFARAFGEHDASITVRGVYSLVGLRANADLMVWLYGPDLDEIQRFAVGLRHTAMGQYLETVETYIGVVTPARYDPGHQPSFMMGARPKQFVSVYPFVKTTDWYQLPYEQRRELMAEHGTVGRKYAVAREKILAEAGALPQGSNGYGAPANSQANAEAETSGGGVLANTVDSFGLGDYEFILANESDDPSEICRMMESLRAVQVRKFTQLDTPIYLGRLRTPEEAVADL